MLGNVSTGENTPQLSPKQETFISLMLTGVTIVAAAKQAGITEQTAHRWLNLPHFQLALRKAQQSVFEEKLNILKTGVGAALVTLTRNMSDKGESPPSTQVRAAQVWLSTAVELHRVAELEKEMAELKDLLVSLKSQLDGRKYP